MIRPDFQRATAISFAAHLLVFLTAIVVMSLRPPHKSKVYTISLVTPSGSAPARSVPKEKHAPPARRTPPPKTMVKSPAEQAPTPKKPAMAVKKDTTPPKAVPDNSQEKAMEAIEKLRQEKAADKTETQRQASLRSPEDEKRLQELRGRLAAEGASDPAGQVPEGERDDMMRAYSDRIMTSIKRNWAFPDVVSTSLRTEVSITVFADGTIRINRITIPSENGAFNQSVLKAIIKTGKVDPPPFGRNEDVTLNFIPAEK